MAVYHIRNRKNELLDTVEADTHEKAAKKYRPGSRRATGIHGRHGMFVPPITRSSLRDAEQFHVQEQ